MLVVEDDPALGELLRYNLEKSGLRVRIATTGDEALLLLDEKEPDLLLLDWMLPEISGIEICRQVRRDPKLKNLPIILLTARGDENDRVRGLDTGADDYLVKPVSIVELQARIRALLRRLRPSFGAETLAAGELVLNLAQHALYIRDIEVTLGPTEFRLLKYFMERPKRSITRDQILSGVWEENSDIDLRTVDAHIARLRRVLEMAGASQHIHTVRSVGYKFDPP